MLKSDLDSGSEVEVIKNQNVRLLDENRRIV